jgi:hypothetical protein
MTREAAAAAAEGPQAPAHRSAADVLTTATAAKQRREQRREALVEGKAWDVEKVLKSYVAAQKTVTICMNGKAAGDLETLIAEFFQLEAGDPARTEMAERVEALSVEVEAAERTFVLEPMSSTEWNTLIAEHPPTSGMRLQGVDYDVTSFPPVALARCCIVPELTAAQVVELADTVAPGDFKALWDLCVRINVIDPVVRQQGATRKMVELWQAEQAKVAAATLHLVRGEGQ